MKSKISVQKESGMMYMPISLRKGGFTGEVDILANAATVTMVCPGVSLKQVKKSLEIMLDDIKLRMQMERDAEDVI